MKYIVIEIQKFQNGTIAVAPVNTYDNFCDAASRYHAILAAAAISDVAVHTAMILTDTGTQLRLDSFNHTEEEE